MFAIATVVALKFCGSGTISWPPFESVIVMKTPPVNDADGSGEKLILEVPEIVDVGEPPSGFVEEITGGCEVLIGGPLVVDGEPTT